MPAPAIVLGFSGKIKDLVNMPAVERDNVQMIRRYTGGGTVICDHNTVFVSFIMNAGDMPTVRPYPRDIMSWTEQFYNNLFLARGITDFKLRENDYVFGDLKFGGNAQTITRNRWVHHTSFLYDYEPRRMEYLQMPRKQPEYRSNRDHTSFLTKLKEYVPSVESFEDGIENELHRSFETTSMSPVELEGLIAELQEKNDISSLCRTKVEPLEEVLRALNSIPSLVRTGPSCVNI